MNGFKDRKKECREIETLLSSKKFEFLILYGRRRVGKTELVLNTTQKMKRIYYLATGEKNLERFYDVCLAAYPEIANLKKDYEVLFDVLKDKTEVIVIDEFQNMIKEDKNILHLFQSVIDTKLKNSKLKLILLGSSVSLMNSHVLSYQSPLYGRRTASLKLRPVSFLDLQEFFPDYTAEQLTEIYGASDGIPFYLLRIDKPFWRWLEQEIREEKSFLRDEVDFLMRYEFDDPSTYKVILEAIARGKTMVHEIKDFAKLQRTDLSPYLKNLAEVDLIKREVPITELLTSRSGRYYLKDNFLRFWFRFIYPNISSIESGIFDVSLIKKEYAGYLGKIFEDIVMQVLVHAPPFPITKVGRWWWKDKEIDLVAFNEHAQEILFCECKWQEGIDAQKLALFLQEKEKHVQWNITTRKTRYAFFAKSFKKKIREYQGIPVSCFDLGDIERILRKRTRQLLESSTKERFKNPPLFTKT